MTAGQFADKKEIETFKALNIMQQIHGVFSSNGIHNIIRLMHDDIVIYHDTKGEKKDLNFAIDKYQIEIDESMSIHFKTISMVLEHEDDIYKYLIKICINRSHQEHEYPIEIAVSGMIKEFSLRRGETREELKAKMEAIFKTQESYTIFTTTRKLAFEQFLESLRFETMKYIKVDDIKMDIKTRMVIQKDKKQAPPQPAEQEYHGMPYSYFGFGDLILFSLLWSELSYDHHTHISDVDLVTDNGEFISSIGEEGIDVSDASIMDYHQDFDARIADVNAGDSGVFDMNTVDMEETIDTESSRGWFDDMFDGDIGVDLGELF